MVAMGGATVASGATAEEPARVTAPATEPARAEQAATRAEPDTGLAFLSGASILVLGLGVGASLIASNAGRATDNTGWMVMQSGFAAAPLVAHGVVGEWGRGLLFASPSLATTAGTAAVFAVDGKAVRHSVLSEQRVLWSIFAVGLFASGYGVVDSAFADTRARRLVVTPIAGAGFAGIDVEGTL
jgi:hypothetical protein